MFMGRPLRPVVSVVDIDYSPDISLIMPQRSIALRLIEGLTKLSVEKIFEFIHIFQGLCSHNSATAGLITIAKAY